MMDKDDKKVIIIIIIIIKITDMSVTLTVRPRLSLYSFQSAKPRRQ